MSSGRRYPVADRYDELDTQSYRSGRKGRDYEELDLEFLREDYGRSSNAGPLVIRNRPPPERRARSVEREDITIRHRDRDSYRRDAEREEIDVTVKHDHRDSSRPRRREIERDEDFYPRRNARRPDRVEKEEVIIRHEDRGHHDHDDREDIRIQHRHRSRSRPRHSVSQPPRRRAEQDSEEITIRHRHQRSRSRSSSRSHRGHLDKEEIIIRRTERRSPTPPPPPPVPEPIVLPPIVRPPIHEEIHREIITHHRHIDHGVMRARAPNPLPPPREPTPPPRKVEETLEVDIRHRHRNGRDHEDQIIIRDRSRDGRQNQTRPRLRARSSSAGPRRRYYDDDSDVEAEAAYYNRKAMERAYVGEARNGATQDWAIVDVPPGTERVQMDGAGGGSQEITWQRYNGVRRSKFNAGGREIDSGFGMGDAVGRRDPSPERPLTKRTTDRDMWTEITKDLVLREAIESFGIEYEETEFFFYIMDYLRYEDVLQLVELSDNIRYDRRRRIREIEWEREELERRRRYDNRLYEREVIIDRSRRH